MIVEVHVLVTLKCLMLKLLLIRLGATVVLMELCG